MSTTAELLHLLGHEDGAMVWISTQIPDDPRSFTSHWMKVSEVDGFVAEATARGLNCWYAVQRFKGDATSRKGNQVDEVIALYADLDWIYDGKPEGMEPAASIELMNALSEVLGAEPTAVVRSGHGLQPVWTIDPVAGGETGAGLLDWWKAHVLEQARVAGVAVDSGVYDLARVLRCPGSINRKPGTEDVAASMMVRGGKRVDRFTLRERRQMHPAPELPAGVRRREATFTRTGVGDDRAFTPDQAAAYIREQIIEPLAERTMCGGAMWKALWAAARMLSSFSPEFIAAEDAKELLREACARKPGAERPNATYERILEDGWADPDFAARLATEEDLATHRAAYWGAKQAEADAAWREAPEAERLNPFSAVSAAASTLTWEATGGRVQEVRVPRQRQKSTEIGTVLPDADDPVFLPEEFWNARPIFNHLREVAWSAMESPEGVLVAALGLVIARVMPNVMLPAHVGVEASLNLMTVICGDPGDGKSVCRKLADAHLKFTDDTEDVWRFNPSSGQGIAGQFQVLRKVDRGSPPEMVRTRWRAIANVEESDTLQALAANPTSTLSSELRKAAMGEDLGFGNVGETQTNLKEHAYRLVLMMCLQPELGAWLLGDSQGGLPQRFLWCSVRDPRVVEGVEDPGVAPVSLPLEARIDPSPPGIPRGRFIMGSTNAIRDEIREAKRIRKIRGREAGADFDGHAMLTRFKVAGGLALMAGRLGVNDEDWALAGQIMVMSNAAREMVATAVATAAGRENEKKAKGRGKSRVIEEGVVADTVMARCRERVLKIVGEQPGILRRALRERLSTAQKEVFSEVLDQLITEDLIRYEERPTSSAWYLK